MTFKPSAWIAAGLLLLVVLGQGGRWLYFLDWINALAPIWAAIAIAGALFSFLRQSAIAGLGFLLAALLSGERIGGELNPNQSAHADNGPYLHILTFNAWHGLNDSGLAASMIANSGADIVLVQEAGPLMARERGRLLKAFPYQSACTNQRCELAILSRFPMTTPRYRFRDAAGRQFGVGLLTARITFPGGRAVRVATLHLPRLTKWPDGGQYLRQRLAATVGLVADPGLIIGGDFNQVPWSFALQQLDEQMWPMTRVTRATPSYPASIGGKQTVALLPIDHIYAGPLWRARKAWVLPYAGSDHRPVMAELSWASR